MVLAGDERSAVRIRRRQRRPCPLQQQIRKAIGKDVGQAVKVLLEERL
jgi:hypothetical protein